jgi:hypothetical protein
MEMPRHIFLFVGRYEIKPIAFSLRKYPHFDLFIFVLQADGYKSTGCFNLECNGFVPVNDAPITPGDTLEPANGQSKISFKIFKVMSPVKPYTISWPHLLTSKFFPFLIN